MELPFKTPELIEAWNEWLLERKDRKLKKYTDRGLKAAITNLLNISSNDEHIAVEIIKQSINQGWQGLFPLKTVSNGTNRTNNQQQSDSRPGTSVARIDALRRW